MLYDLELERLARRPPRDEDAGTEGARLLELAARQEAHPEQIAGLALGLIREGGLPDLDARLAVLDRIADRSPGQDRAGRATAEFLEVVLDQAMAKARVGDLARHGRLLRRVLGQGAAATDHLERFWDRAREALRDRQPERFAALHRYLAIGLARGGAGIRPALARFLEGYRLLRICLGLEPAAEWLEPLLGSLEQAVTGPRGAALLASEPELVCCWLPPLWSDLVDLASAGDEPRLLSVTSHLAGLAGRLPPRSELHGAFGLLPRILEAAPGGVRGRLARAVLQVAGESASGPVPVWREFEARLASAIEDRRWRLRVAASLRPRQRSHLHRFLDELRAHQGDEPTVAALYASTRVFPYPLIVLYHGRHGAGLARRVGSGPLDIHLQKLGVAYRMRVFHPNLGLVLSSHSFLDEASTVPFRRALMRSGGTYAVALVELETLEVRALRFQAGYLDFTGAYFRGIEHLIAQETEPAIREFEKALAANPRLRGVNCHLGACYRKLARSRRDLDRSISCYQRELTVDPASGDALNNLGVLSLAEGRLDEAIEYLERAVRAEPSHLTALANLTTTCLASPNRAGGVDRVRDLLRRMWTLDPDSPTLAKLAGEASTAFSRDLLGELRLDPG